MLPLINYLSRRLLATPSRRSRDCEIGGSTIYNQLSTDNSLLLDNFLKLRAEHVSQ
jgi:hypothetical protein